MFGMLKPIYTTAQEAIAIAKVNTEPTFETLDGLTFNFDSYRTSF